MATGKKSQKQSHQKSTIKKDTPKKIGKKNLKKTAGGDPFSNSSTGGIF